MNSGSWGCTRRARATRACLLRLLEDDALPSAEPGQRLIARLLDAYRSAGAPSLLECRVVNVPEPAPGITPAEMSRRQAISLRLLRAKLAGEAWAPNLIVKPRLSVTLLGLVFNIEPDALVAADGEAFYRPVEIKSYPDREGKTEAADLRGWPASERRQPRVIEKVPNWNRIWRVRGHLKRRWPLIVRRVIAAS